MVPNIGTTITQVIIIIIRNFFSIPLARVISAKRNININPEPRSGCFMIRTKGGMANAITANPKFFGVIKPLKLDKYFARAIIKINLKNSVGWKEIKPRLSHLLAPIFPCPPIKTNNKIASPMI
jgi:hypothetical protein